MGDSILRQVHALHDQVIAMSDRVLSYTAANGQTRTIVGHGQAVDFILEVVRAVCHDEDLPAGQAEVVRVLAIIGRKFGLDTAIDALIGGI